MKQAERVPDARPAQAHWLHPMSRRTTCADSCCNCTPDRHQTQSRANAVSQRNQCALALLSLMAIHRSKHSNETITKQKPDTGQSSGTGLCADPF